MTGLLAAGANGETWWISLIKSVIVINLVLFVFIWMRCLLYTSPSPRDS